MATIEEHIETFAADAQDAVRAIYAHGKSLAPAAEEGVSYGVPCLKANGKPFCAVQKSAKHLSLIAFSSDAIVTAADALAGVPTTKGSVQFTAETPLSNDVVDAVLRARLAEIEK